MRYLKLVLLSVAWTGCSSTQTKQPIASSWFKESPGSFGTPKGWLVKKPPQPSETSNLLVPKEKKAHDSSSITLEVFHQSDAATQDGLAESYLAGIHDVKDENVRFEKLLSVEHPVLGPISIFRFHSAWYGDHLVANFPVGDGYATAELWTQNEEARQRHTDAFIEFVKGIDLQKSARLVQP